MKFRPEETLLDRHALMRKLAAEGRAKLVPLDVYRVEVSDTADLPPLIQAHAGDARVKYIAMNMTVSVSEPK